MADSGAVQGDGERSILLSVSSKTKPAAKSKPAAKAISAEPKWVVKGGTDIARSQRALARARQLIGNEQIAYAAKPARASKPLPPPPAEQSVSDAVATPTAVAPAGAAPAGETLGAHAGSLSVRESAMEKALARDDTMIHQLRSRWKRSKRTRRSKERSKLRVKAEEQVP